MIGDPYIKLKEDPLRILRAIRFATVLDFDLDNELLDAIKCNYKLVGELSKERIKALLITLAVIIGIILILWFLPPTHNWLVGIYESNGIIKTFVDIIVAIVTGIFKGIGEFFASLFE